MRSRRPSLTRLLGGEHNLCHFLSIERTVCLCRLVYSDGVREDARGHQRSCFNRCEELFAVTARVADRERERKYFLEHDGIVEREVGFKVGAYDGDNILCGRGS